MAEWGGEGEDVDVNLQKYLNHLHILLVILVKMGIQQMPLCT